MTTTQLLSALPALLGFTGLVIYYFFERNRGGDQVTLTIVNKLRIQAPDRLPANAEKMDASNLTKLIEGDFNLRSRIDDQDFQLLRDALRQQFITSLIAYGLSGLIFMLGIGLYVYLNPPAKAASIGSFVVESDNPEAKGLVVDLDDLVVRWTATGDAEDIKISLEAMDQNRRTEAKTVRSTQGRVVFAAGDYRPILPNRTHNSDNRLRVVTQTQKNSFFSQEFSVRVGITIVIVRFDNSRIKMMGTIDNRAINFYDFEGKLSVIGAKPNGEKEPIIFGGIIPYGKNDFAIDNSITFDWSSKKFVYFGPDDRRTVRVEYLGF